VAATNRDLAATVRDGSFRTDLLDRLSTLCVHTPSLAEREEDLPDLIRHFVGLANAQEGAQMAPPSAANVSAARAELVRANIRRLRSAIGRLAVVKRRGTVTGKEIIQVLRDLPGHSPASDSPAAISLGDRIHIELDVPRGTAFNTIIREVEKEVSMAFLSEAGGSVSVARRALGVSKDVWYRILRSEEAKRSSKNWR